MSNICSFSRELIFHQPLNSQEGSVAHSVGGPHITSSIIPEQQQRQSRGINLPHSDSLVFKGAQFGYQIRAIKWMGYVYVWKHKNVRTGLSNSHWQNKTSECRRKQLESDTIFNQCVAQLVKLFLSLLFFLFYFCIPHFYIAVIYVLILRPI